MTVVPIPLDLREEPRPMRWRCLLHGELPVGECSCDRCDLEREKRPA